MRFIFDESAKLFYSSLMPRDAAELHGQHKWTPKERIRRNMDRHGIFATILMTRPTTYISCIWVLLANYISTVEVLKSTLLLAQTVRH